MTEAGKALQITSSEFHPPRSLVERKYFNTETSDHVEVHVNQLAVLLREAGSHNFRTLPFGGYSKDEDSSCFDFFFEYPTGALELEPMSLHDLITDRRYRDRVSLPQRFRIAQAIAQSIGAFHSDSWVHKSTRSHAIKFFLVEESSPDLENPYLTDFEFSRPDGGFTTHIEHGLMDPEISAYRHPDRDMYGQPTVSFNKFHDVYSLGVVLLEIGLWKTAGGMFEEIQTRLQADDPQHRSPTNNSIRKIMKYIAGREPPHRMGEAYKGAVMTCLSDEFEKYHLGQDSFAITFEKSVAEMVDVRKLYE